MCGLGEGSEMMVLWKFASCPRCKGDVFITFDAEGWYEQCLLCSHRRDLKDLNEFKKPKTTIRKTKPRTRSPDNPIDW